MSAGWIIALALAVAVYAYMTLRIWRAARRAGESDTIVFVCVIGWPVVAAWLAFKIVQEAARALRIELRHRKQEARDDRRD